MSDFDKGAALASIRLGEGVRLVVYDDATGKPLKPGMTLIGHATIGSGIALDTGGITEAESDYLAQNRINARDAGLEAAYPWYSGLSEARRRVLIEIAYIVGLVGFSEFHKMIAAIETGDFTTAGDGIIASTLAKGRAVRLANLMKAGA